MHAWIFSSGENYSSRHKLNICLPLFLHPCSPIERGAGHVFTEADWALVPSETVLPYFYSKREAEKRAWALAEEQTRCDHQMEGMAMLPPKPKPRMGASHRV